MWSSIRVEIFLIFLLFWFISLVLTSSSLWLYASLVFGRVERFLIILILLVCPIGSHLYLLKVFRRPSKKITTADCTNEGGTVSALFPARLQQGRHNWNARIEWVAAREDDRKVRQLCQSHGRAQPCLAIVTASQLVSFEQPTPDSTCGSCLTRMRYRKRA